MKKPDIRRRYLHKLLQAFLMVSIVPLLLSIVAIIASSYLYTLEQYDRQMQSILIANNGKLDRLIEEHIVLIDSLATSIGAYADGSEMDFSSGSTELDIISTMMAGRKDKMNIHILSSNGFEYHTGPTSNFYDLKAYGQWGLLYSMNHSDAAIVVGNASFGQGSGTAIFSVGMRSQQKYGTDQLYTIIDITRQSVDELLLAEQDPLAKFLLIDSQGIILMDTSHVLREGFYLDAEEYAQALQGGNHIVTRDNTEYFVGSLKSSITGNTLFAFLPAIGLGESMKNLITITLPILLVTLCLCFIIAERITKSMYRPIDSMVGLISSISDGDLSVRMEIGTGGNDEINLVATGFNHMLDRINELLEKVIEQTERQKEAEFKALQAQINPHFLYNMLNEIKALAKLNRTQEVSEFVVCLGKLLRSTITESGQFVTVSEDVDFVEAYLNLQRIRFENTFEINVRIDDDILQCRILKLILQPIVENSILHGLENSISGGKLSLVGFRQRDCVCFEIYDSGCGVNQDYMSYINNVSRGASMYGSHGLENVQKRLLLVYGSEYGIRIESQKGSYTMVRVYIPYEQMGE